jgi:DNA polymerase III alpha subunit
MDRRLQDARRHGVFVVPAQVKNSGVAALVEADRKIRVRLEQIHGLKKESLEFLVRAREEAPFESLAGFLRRTQSNETERRALAAVGAFSPDKSAELLTPMPILERVRHDFALTGLTVGDHPNC